MLGQAHRFHGYGSLRFAYSNGQTVRGTLMGIRYCNNPKRQAYRVAVVVSKKVSKSAVVRNRIRRRVYALIRQAHLAEQPAYDIIVTVFNQAVADIPAQELTNELNEMLDRTEVKRAAPRGIIETKES